MRIVLASFTRAAMVMTACMFWMSAAPAAVVYDNTTTSLNSFSGLGTFWRGDEITLAGSERVVTEFLFGYIAPTSSTESNDGTLRFYANDGAGGTPGTVLFEAAFQYLRTGTPQDHLFSGLSVLVPNTFTWAVELPRIGLRLFDPPTIGSSEDFHWLSDDDAATWRQINFTNAVDNFSARVTAIPEPGGWALMVAALGLLGWMTRQVQGRPASSSAT